MAVNTSTGNPSTSSNPNTPLQDRIDVLSKKLQILGANNGARRIEVVAQQIQHFTVEGATHYIRKEEIIDEIEAHGNWWLSSFYGLRNLLSIAPIAFTWLALHIAADAYQADLHDSHYPNDLYQPFLLLWQENFHGNHGFVISFSAAALSDAILLIGLIALAVIIIPWSEQRHRQAIRTSLGDFDGVIDELLVAISKDGANSHLADSDVNKISKAIEGALQKVLLNYDRVAGEARKFIETTNKSTQGLVKNFEDNLAVFNSDVVLLNDGLNRLDTNLGDYGQKLSDLTSASSTLATSSTDLAQNAKNMAESATQSSVASQGISQQLSALNTTQQDIVKSQQQVASTIAQTQGEVVKQFATTQTNVVQEIERTQKNVVQDISGVADTMGKSAESTRDVAKEMDRVAQDLEKMIRTDFQSMTDQVGKAASQVDRVAASLGGVDAQLQQTTQALTDAAQAFARVSGKAGGQSKSGLAGKILYSSMVIAAFVVIGEIAVLIMHSH